MNRSYTIASSPTRGHYVEISVKRDGLASKWLHASLHEGDRIKVSAPAGKFHFAGGVGDGKRVILVAGGVGITPMMAVIRSLTDRGWDGEMYLLFAVKQRKDVIFEQELTHLAARHPNLHVKITVTAGEPGDVAGGIWDGSTGRLAREHVVGFVPEPSQGPVMLCGPEPQMQAARKLFRELGVPDEQIHEEAFVSPPAPPEGVADEAIAMADAAVDPDAEHQVAFKRAGKSVASAGLTILEAAEEAEVAISFECRSGICGQCKCKLVSGRVVMDVQDALTAADRAKGLILACQARPVRDVEIDV